RNRRVEDGEVRLARRDGDTRARHRRDAARDRRGTAASRLRRARAPRARDGARRAAFGGRRPDRRDRRPRGGRAAGSRRRLVAIGVAVLAAAGGGIATAASRHDGGFAVTKLVTDARDGKLVNAWGLAASPTGPWWVANEARNASTLYAANGRKQML